MVLVLAQRKVALAPCGQGRGSKVRSDAQSPSKWSVEAGSDDTWGGSYPTEVPEEDFPESEGPSGPNVRIFSEARRDEVGGGPEESRKRPQPARTAEAMGARADDSLALMEEEVVA